MSTEDRLHSDVEPIPAFRSWPAVCQSYLGCLSGALLTYLVWGNKKAAEHIETAVFNTLPANTDLSTGTTAMTKAIVNRLYPSEILDLFSEWFLAGGPRRFFLR